MSNWRQELRYLIKWSEQVRAGPQVRFLNLVWPLSSGAMQPLKPVTRLHLVPNLECLEIHASACDRIIIKRKALLLCVANQALRYERYGRSTCAWPSDKLEVSDQSLPVPSGNESECLSESVWLLWQKENAWRYRDSNTDSTQSLYRIQRGKESTNMKNEKQMMMNMTEKLNSVGRQNNILKNAVLWDVTLCSSCKNRRFGGKCRLHHQGDKSLLAGTTLAVSNYC
jgi:hypothetical protein